MSNLRSGKAIKPEVFEQTQNTLFISDGYDIQYFSKIEEKIEALNNYLDNQDQLVCFVWVGAKRSDVFNLDTEDIERLLDSI